MIQTGGRNDVLVQWFSREFMDNHKELFEKVVIQPGEALFTLKDGKIGEVVTETTKDILPGFLGKIKEAIGSKKDIQLLVVDLKPRMLQIPLEGFSKDRVEIKGVANIMAKISRENIYRVINMFPRGLKSDAKWEDNTQVKEICDEDLSGFFVYDSKAAVDSFVFTKWESSQIRDNLSGLVSDVTQCVNEMMPHWTRYGLDVTVNSIDMTKNGYEDVQKFKALIAQKQMIEEIKFADKHTGLGNVAALERERVRLQQAIDMDKLSANLELEDSQLKADLRRNLEITENSVKELEIKLTGEMAKAKTADEIRKLNGATDLELKKMQDEQTLYVEKERNTIMQENQDHEVDRILILSNNKLKLEYEEKFSSMKGECIKQISAAEAKVERAYDEGYRAGSKEEGERQYKLGYSEGLAAGIEKQAGNTIAAVEHTAGAFKQQSPYEHPYPGYGYGQPYGQPVQQVPTPQKPPENGEFMFCGECGNKIAVGTKFCPKCGNHL